MDPSQKTNDLLKDYFSIDHFNAKPVLSNKLIKARQLVIDRKNKSDEQADIFMMLATFLNLKIKLYHAVIALILISSVIFLNNRNDARPQIHISTSEHNSELVAAKNGTVLSCIQTFVSPQ